MGGVAAFFLSSATAMACFKFAWWCLPGQAKHQDMWFVTGVPGLLAIGYGVIALLLAAYLAFCLVRGREVRDARYFICVPMAPAIPIAVFSAVSNKNLFRVVWQIVF